MTHTEMDELYELYALGALEPELAAEIEQHLAENCPHCVERVREALELSAALAGITEERRPPVSLRNRILASVAPRRARQSRIWAFAVAGLSAACIALAAFAITAHNQEARERGEREALRSEVAITRGQLAEVTAERDRLAAAGIERNQLRAALAVLSTPDIKAVTFGGENAAHGRVFVNSRGGLLFVGAQLPRLANNRTFELWVVPRKGGPRPAGLFQADASGESVRVSATPVDRAETKAVAVSIEPSEGSPAPTSTPILIVPLQ